jgi:hypothetical protein
MLHCWLPKIYFPLLLIEEFETFTPLGSVVELVIRANHMISLIISSTTDPRCSDCISIYGNNFEKHITRWKKWSAKNWSWVVHCHMVTKQANHNRFFFFFFFFFTILLYWKYYFYHPSFNSRSTVIEYIDVITEIE